MVEGPLRPLDLEALGPLDISGGSATLDASLVHHETDSVAGMMLAGEVRGHQSLRCILLLFRGRFAQQQSPFKKKSAKFPQGSSQRS